VRKYWKHLDSRTFKHTLQNSKKQLEISLPSLELSAHLLKYGDRKIKIQSSSILRRQLRKTKSASSSGKGRKPTCAQELIEPVTLGGAILVIFGSQVSLRVHYCRKAEIYFTTLLWQNNGRQNSFICRECYFPNCTKSWWIKVLPLFFWGRSPVL